MTTPKTDQKTLDLPSLRRILNSPRQSPQEAFSHYSILIPIVNLNGLPHVLYEVRASHMKTQPNEVCFPGGKIEPLEEPSAAAVRETMEELGIPAHAIDIIAEIDKVITPFHLILHVFVAELKLENAYIKSGNLYYGDTMAPASTELNHDEVSEIFAVPLSWLMEHPPLTYTTVSKMTFPPDFPFHLIQNGEAYNWRTSANPILFYENPGPTIWGITARITKNLIDCLSEGPSII